MKKYIFILFLLTGLSFFTFSQKYNNPQIKSLKGFLFYNQENFDDKLCDSFSENIIDNSDFSLFNTIVGEGSAKGPSTNTLIIVDIIYNPNISYSNGNVRLIVTDKKNKVIFTQMQNYYLISEKGNTYSAPFLLYDTGCGYLKIKAELIGRSKKGVISVMEKNIEFNCGE